MIKKYSNLAWRLIIALTLFGCGSPAETYAGVWTSNLGKVSLKQNGSQITGLIEGYGGVHNETFMGTLISENEAQFSTTWFGDFNLVFGIDDFRSKSPELSFCAIRAGKSDTLPDGCGFSGTWLVPAKSVFREGTTLVLKQTADKVNGDLYDNNGKVYDSFAGFLYWGKGWVASGKLKERGAVTLRINAAETGFEFAFGDGANPQQLCAVRGGQASAYLGSYTCNP